MQKNRLSTKVFSVVLSLLMILTVIPLIPFTTTADAASTEYYYPSGTKYIKDLAIIYYKSSSEGQGVIKSTVGHDAGTGYALLKDLTAGTGGDYYVYLGWTWTYNPNEAVRGFRIEHNGSVASSYYQSGVYWYPINSGVHSWVPQLHSDGCVDLNRGAGGDDIKLYLTKDPAFGPPVTFLDRAGSTGERDSLLNSGYTGVVTFSDNGYIIDVNKGAGGDDLFLLYKRDTSVTTVNTSSLRTVYNNTAAYDGKAGYTPASSAALSSARNQAKTIMDAFDNNNGYASYTQATINGVVNSMNNAVNNLKTNFYLDASTNGGSPDQTIELTVGTSSTATVDLSKYTATKEGSSFAGWAKSSLATKGSTDTVTVGFNETYYALFGKQLTANFHYLLADGTIKKDSKSVYAMNAATAAATPLPSAKDVVINGKTYTFLGWREDTQAADKTINKTGVYTIYETNPNVNVYAVYSTPITLTHDSNKGTPVIDADVQTQYINANTELTKTAHDFYVTDAAIEREGATFLGWSDTADDTATVKYVAGDKITITEDLTIYAAYEYQYVNVTFVGADGEIETQKVPYGDHATAPAETPLKDYDEENHYAFAGWDTDFSVAKTDLTVTALFDAIPHTIEDEITKAPDCTNTGTKDQYCIGCDYEVLDVVIEALGHNEVKQAGQAATCTMAGITEKITCQTCQEVLQTPEVIPALGHSYTYDISTLVESVTPTCVTGGYSIYKCSRENCEFKEKTNIVPPTGEHVAYNLKAIEATCTTNGLTAGSECLHCGSVIVAQQTVFASHSIVKIPVTRPTCTETGLTAGEYCENCDYEVAQTIIPATGHSWESFDGIAATCTEDGIGAGSVCKNCNTTVGREVIPAHGHDYIATVTAPTCEKRGYTTYVCKYNEKHSYVGDYTDVIAHTGGTATCSEYAVCAVCSQKYGELADHDYVATVIPATCTSEGYTSWVCSVCSDSYTSDKVKKASHTYNDGVVTTAPDCTTEGVKTFTCENCTASFTTAIAATGHNITWEVVEDVAYGTCANCSEQFEADPSDVGLDVEEEEEVECERCGMVHRYNSGLFKYKGIYCSIVYFFRQIANFFKGNA